MRNGITVAVGISAMIVFALFGIFTASCQDIKTDPTQLFYVANSYYQKGEYQKALDDYNAIVKMGLGSPALYYNIGNAYFKTGKLGNAILFYRKARNLAPRDSDIRTNLSFARSLVGYSGYELPQARMISRFIKWPFRWLNLDEMVYTSFGLYILVIALAAISIINPVTGRKLRVVILLLVAVFIYVGSALGLRYYDQVITTRGIILDKDVECKYEPVDNSNTYYRLQEGSEVMILKNKEGWTQIRRPDNKVAWLKTSAIGAI